MTRPIPIVEDDVLVVGGGDAAIRAALSAAQAGARVRVIVKSKLMEGGSSATGVSDLMSIGAAMGFMNKEDNPQIHYEDTINAADGFISPALTKLMTAEVPDRVRELIDWGVPFEKNENGFLQRQSDFARYPRVMWVKGGGTAREILRVMLQKLRELQVPLEEETMVFELLEKDGAFAGALGVRKSTGEIVYFRAKAVILGTGGAHGIYPHSVASPDMTGDGYAMASRLGLPLANMEFVQCGPGVIWPTLVVLSGPVYRNNPTFIDVNGREIIQDYAPPGVSAADVVNQKVYPYTTSDISTYLDIAIYRRMREGPTTEHGGVYMDLRGKEDLAKRLPVTTAKLQQFGIDPMTQLLETGIVTQCMNGGVQMESADAETKVRGVYVVGEVAGGVRGPDRPGGNSLCECQVFGNRAGKAAAHYAKAGDFVQPSEPVDAIARHKTSAFRENGKLDVAQVIAAIRKTMWDNCLVIRNEQGLRTGLDTLQELSHTVARDGLSCGRQNITDAFSLVNMLDTAGIILTASLARKESRGPHYREDYPEQNDAEWKRIIHVRRNSDSSFTSEFAPAE